MKDYLLKLSEVWMPGKEKGNMKSTEVTSGISRQYRVHFKQNQFVCNFKKQCVKKIFFPWSSTPACEREPFISDWF